MNKVMKLMMSKGENYEEIKLPRQSRRRMKTEGWKTCQPLFPLQNFSKSPRQVISTYYSLAKSESHGQLSLSGFYWRGRKAEGECEWPLFIQFTLSAMPTQSRLALNLFSFLHQRAFIELWTTLGFPAPFHGTFTVYT